MDEAAISISNLGKRYRLRQQSTQRYTALRDVIQQGVRQIITRSSRSGNKAAGEEFWALQDVSFEVRRGEVIGVIGRNGAGKSTLLKLLCRITAPTTGRIALRGRVASLLEAGTGFHSELTGRENIFLNGAILGMTKSETSSRFDEIVAFAEVDRFLDTPVKHYSSGMHMRLAFAVAAHLRPDILVVDEVLAVGDAAFQQKCLRKMDSAVAAEGVTVIFVSHNMDSVLRLATRSVVLEAGRVRFVGGTKEGVDLYGSHLAAQGAELDLSASPRPGHLRGQALLLRALPAATSTQGWTFPFGENIAFQVDVNVLAPLRDVSLGVGLFAATGTEIASMQSAHSLALPTLPPGRHRMSVEYRGLRLVPGVYTLGIGLQSERGLEDYLPQALQFTVASNTASAAMHTDTFRGFTVPETHCTLSSLD
ncbi:MAG: transporter-like protein [Verrucomicrobiaceae bacterium]|nr:transporter-like protein [Verrucomicrobiaceae bacterium]